MTTLLIILFMHENKYIVFVGFNIANPTIHPTTAVFSYFSEKTINFMLKSVLQQWSL